MAEHCCEKITDLRKELNSLTEAFKKRKQEYQTLLIENLQKDLIIRQIKTKIEEKKFSSFEDQLSKDCIVKLNLIGNSQKEDSTFVALAINELYRGNSEAIKHKVIKESARSKKSGKSEISPKKKKFLERLFAERISYFANVDETRENNLNKLIRNAIDNANKK